MSTEPCRHTGSQRCPRCSWTRPSEAVSLVLRGRTARTALPVAAVAGTVLSLVNQGSVIFAGTATTGTWMRVAANYAVPFLVASTGYLSGRRVRREVGWERYLADFHDERPGVTEMLLTPATTKGGDKPYPWLAESLRTAPGPILDLACGSAPTRPLLRERRWLGVDVSAGELSAAATAGRGPLVRARADALPLADGSIGAVCAAMCLPVLTPLEDALSELRRVLRPGGALVALVPSGRGYGVRGLLRWWQVMRTLGVRSQPWPNPRARDGLARILREHGFVVESDEHRVFRREISNAADVALLVDGLYLPSLAPDRIEAAKRTLASWARPGRWLPFPLRRVVAHLPEQHTRGESDAVLAVSAAELGRKVEE